MERPKPVELARDVIRIGAAVGRYALHQIGCSAWADLGDKYGEALGGHLPHPASIQLYTTGEQLQLDIPANIVVGTE